MSVLFSRVFLEKKKISFFIKKFVKSQCSISQIHGHDHYLEFYAMRAMEYSKLHPIFVYNEYQRSEVCPFHVPTIQGICRELCFKDTKINSVI